MQFRQSQDNMRHALNITDNMTKTYKESVFLCVDAKKPFDSAQSEYLYLVLRRFGFINQVGSCLPFIN